MKRVLAFVLILFVIPLVASATERDICSKAYYTVLETNWNISQNQIEEANNLLNISNFSEYLEKPYTLCVSKGLTDSFPEKPREKIYLSPPSNNSCQLNDLSLLGDSIPLIKFNLGNPPCGLSKLFNLFFKINQDVGFYSKGIRPLPFVYIAIIVAIIWVFISNRKVDRFLESKI